MVCSMVLSNARLRYNLGRLVMNGSGQATRMIPGTGYQKSTHGQGSTTYIGQESAVLPMFASKHGRLNNLSPLKERCISNFRTNTHNTFQGISLKATQLLQRLPDLHEQLHLTV